MTPKVCSYSIIRFSPFVETEEFANVGVLLSCEKIGFFDFKIQKRKHKRITDFFEPMTAEVYKQGIESTQLDLQRLRRAINPHFYCKDQTTFEFSNVGTISNIFEEVTRPREGIIQYSNSRVILSTDPKKTLEKLYGHYVDRHFASESYGEALLEKNFRGILSSHDLQKKFSIFVMDDGLYKKTFQFTEMRGAKVVKIIKPFYLAQKRPTQIIDHGMTWVTAINRFRKAQKLPKDVMFAVEPPKRAKALLFEAFEETVQKIKDQDVRVVNFEEEGKLLKFAGAILQ